MVAAAFIVSSNWAAAVTALLTLATVVANGLLSHRDRHVKQKALTKQVGEVQETVNGRTDDLHTRIEALELALRAAGIDPQPTIGRRAMPDAPPASSSTSP